MEARSRADDLAFVRDVMARAERRIDPHAFHFVSWGAVVLVWYPLMNWLEESGRRGAMLWVGLAALVLGFALSGLLEWRRTRRPVPAAEDTFVGRQVVRIVAACIAAAALLSAVGPATQAIPGERVPIVWGFAYAVMAYAVGVVYRDEFRWAGAFIFVGTVAALLLPHAQGYVLGPVMGLGMIVPGVMAERRVARLRLQEVGEPRD